MFNIKQYRPKAAEYRNKYTISRQFNFRLFVFNIICARR
jgi:hypothetical protein